MNFRYTYIGILNLDFYNKCCTLLIIIIIGVLILMGLILLFFTRGTYLVLSDLITWRMENISESYVEEYCMQKFWSSLGRLNFYWQSKTSNFMQKENESLEIGWTLLPVFILLLLLVPSLNLLFLMDNTKLPMGEEFRTWMVTGHQWYWEYKTIKSDLVSNNFSFEVLKFRNLQANVDFCMVGKEINDLPEEEVAAIKDYPGFAQLLMVDVCLSDAEFIRYINLVTIIDIIECFDVLPDNNDIFCMDYFSNFIFRDCSLKEYMDIVTFFNDIFGETVFFAF